LLSDYAGQRNLVIGLSLCSNSAAAAGVAVDLLAAKPTTLARWEAKIKSCVDLKSKLMSSKPGFLGVQR
jgi:hypothetical protein